MWIHGRGTHGRPTAVGLGALLGRGREALCVCVGGGWVPNFGSGGGLGHFTLHPCFPHAPCPPQGQATDIAIQAEEILKLKRQINGLYAKHTGQPLPVIGEVPPNPRCPPVSAGDAPDAPVPPQKPPWSGTGT